MTTQAKFRRRAAWADSLPQIIGALWGLLESQGRSTGGHCGGDEEWADLHARGVQFNGLIINEEGDYEGGPYRLMVYADSTEDGVNISGPFLKLEIRPSLLWINEVKRATAEPVAAK
jgi:hypothetical protein